MSRDIPIVVDPGFEASVRNRRRGSDSTNYASNIHQIPEEKTSDDKYRSFQRRHSEDPNTASSHPNYYRSPRYEEGKKERLKRRGSAPVYGWNDPLHGGRDRFAEIVERIMNANDDELLSGLMDERFEPPFDVEEIHEERSGPEGTTFRHELRRPSAPVVGAHGSNRPFNMNYKKDNDGCIEIPVQVWTSDESNRNEEKLHEKPEKVSGEEDSKASKDGEFHTSKKPEVEISLDTTEIIHGNSQRKDKNTTDNDVLCAKADKSQENLNEQTTASNKSKEQTEQAKGETTTDDAKLLHIKEIENKLKQTHEEVLSFNGNNSKMYLVLEELLMEALMSLDAVEASGNAIVREARKAVVKRVQEDLKELEKKRIPCT